MSETNSPELIFNEKIYVTDAWTLDTNRPLNEFTDPKKSVNNERAQAELDAIAEGYRTIGSSVVSFASPRGEEGYQDVIYAANQAFILNNKALVANLPYERKKEEDLATKWLENDLNLETVRMPEELGLFSGKGDALYIPGTTLVLAGSGYRNSQQSHAFLEETFDVKVLPFRTIPRRVLFGVQNDFIGKPYSTLERDGSTLNHSPAYDLDIAIGILKGQTEQHKALIAYAPSLLRSESRTFMEEQTLFDTIKVGRTEAMKAFGCNLVSNGRGVVINKDAKKLIKDIEAHGLFTVPVENVEIAKGGGGVHCVENAYSNTTPDFTKTT